MKAIIPMAGRGTRLYPLGISTPKALIKILNKPLINWALECLITNGISEVIFIIAPDDFGKQIQNYVRTQHFDIKINFVIQDQPLGNAHALQQTVKFFDKNEDFIFLNGDDLYGPENVKQLMDHDGLATVGVKVDDPRKYSVLSTDKNGILINLVEKPQEFTSNLANVNCMKLNSRIFDFYADLEISPRGEYEITNNIIRLSKEMPIKVFADKDYWLPVGYPWQLLLATEHLAKLTNFGSDVVLGRDCQIDPSAIIQNSVIGDNVIIKAGCVVKNSVIADGVVLNENVSIEDALPGGENVKTLIKGEMADTGLKNFGATIGEKVEIGANVIIKPGVKIWPGKNISNNEVITQDIE